MHALVKVVLVLDVFLIIQCAESQQERHPATDVPGRYLRTPRNTVPELLTCIYTTRRGSPTMVRDRKARKQELTLEQPVASVSIDCPTQYNDYRSLCGATLEIFEGTRGLTAQLSREKRCGATWKKWVVGLRFPRAAQMSFRRRLQRCSAIVKDRLCLAQSDVCTWEGDVCRVLTEQEKEKLKEETSADHMWALIVSGIFVGCCAVAFGYWWYRRKQWLTFYQDAGVLDEDGETKKNARTDVRLYSSDFGIPRDGNGDRQARKAGYTVKDTKGKSRSKSNEVSGRSKSQRPRQNGGKKDRRSKKKSRR